jgi:hypothetical protein
MLSNEKETERWDLQTVAVMVVSLAYSCQMRLPMSKVRKAAEKKNGRAAPEQRRMKESN